MIKKRLGDMLIVDGLLTPEQLSEALKEQKLRRRRLGKVLIELELISEESMLECLSRQLSVPLIDIHTYEIEPEVLRLVPASIAKKHLVMPIMKEGDSIILAMADPLDVFVVDQIQYRSGCRVDIVLAPEADISSCHTRYYGATEEMEQLIGEMGAEAEAAEKVKAVAGVSVDGTGDVESTASPVIQFANLIIKQAIEERASDIHVEPEENKLRVRYRIDGVLREIVQVPPNLTGALISRLKIMAGMDIAEKRLPQDGRIQVKLETKELDLRVNSLRTVWGEKIVLRVLDRTSVLMGLDRLGFLSRDMVKFRKIITEPNGIVLLTGPTGSGKTSTLYAALNEVKSPEINITTIENPVEYRLELINQVQTHTEIGMSFAYIMRSILRQDPDVIMVGEIRDEETARIATEAALTGHLVFSTLHTNDAPGAIVRLLEMGIESYLLTPTILCVLAQRLVRKICEHCREEHIPDDSLKAELGLKVEKEMEFCHGAGCSRCGRSGYLGRTGIHEMMVMTENLRKLIVSRPSIDQIRRVARREGMQILRENALIKARKGITSLSEVLRVTKGA